jgi:hypothetical protein
MKELSSYVLFRCIDIDNLEPLVHFMKKVTNWDNLEHIKTHYFLHNHLPLTYCSKGSFLFLEWTGKLTAVAT